MAKHTVVGMTRFKGDVEGQHYDQTKLRVLLKASSRKSETEVGFGETAVVIGKSDEFDKLKHLVFPCHFDLELEMTTKGIEVASFRPLAPVASPKAA